MYLESLLLQPHPVDQMTRDTMLKEINVVFTEYGNQSLCKLPTYEEVRSVMNDSNLTAAPGTDGIPSLLYSTCWNVLGDPLTEVVQSIHQGVTPTRSMSNEDKSDGIWV